MDEKTLSEIEERLNAATSGPWELSSSGYSVRAAGGHKVAEVHIQPARVGEMIDTLDFIAHAREDVTTLLAEVRRLRAACVCRACQGPGGCMGGWVENGVPVLLCERCDANWKLDAAADRVMRENP